MNLDELETPCAACTHTLADHLNGAGPWDWCQACADCPNFVIDGDCLTCFNKRLVVDEREAEHPCPDCRR